MIDTGLRGRVVLVSGATRSVGRVAAQVFAAEGAWIAVNYRADVAGAKSLVDAIRSDGGRALLAPGDVRTSEGAWTVARYVEHEWAQIDILLHAAALLGSDEIAADATPLLTELVLGMCARGWGRTVVLSPSGTTGIGRDLAARWGAPDVLVNVLLLSPGDDLKGREEAVARTMLFLGSAWNMCVTGATLDIDSEMVDEQHLSSPLEEQ
jgi:NAD(P)-dependent dehydrogenase (short-subunit alcohol dehydrogenase family)